jgi:hypothetical protein
VRRISAILLLALFSFSLISPAVLAADPESSLPACCRRNGKHHCAMMAIEAASSSGPSLQAAPCASFPSIRAVPTSAATGLLKTPAAVFASVLSRPAAHPQTEQLLRNSFTLSGQKRGPPLSRS